MTFRFANSRISLGLVFWVWGFDEILIGLCLVCGWNLSSVELIISCFTY